MNEFAHQPLLAQLISQEALSATEAGIIVWWWNLEGRPAESLEAFVERKHLIDAPEITAVREGRTIDEQAASELRMTLRALVEKGDDGSGISDSTLTRPTAPNPVGSSIIANSAMLRRPALGTTPARVVQAGSTLGNCLLIERLGQGASGIVFRGIHQVRQIPVAVKVLRPHLRKDAHQFALFQAEARTLASLEHPNLVRILEFEEDADFPYLVMEYIEGFSLDQLIRQSGPIRLARALGIINQVVLGLAFAHANGVLHRDVKPTNILIDQASVVKLVDLGLSIAMTTSESTAAARLHGELVGTPLYLSPEQARSPQSVDHRADIYALGATFYHAITGRPPFESNNKMQLLLKHLRETPIAPHEVRPEIPVEASRIILRMLAKKPADRFASYDELAIALVDLLVSIESGPVLVKASQMTPIGMEYHRKPFAPTPNSVRSPIVAPAVDSVTPAPIPPPPIEPPDPIRLVRQILREGITAAKNNERSRAATLFRQVTELDPRNELAWTWLAGVVDNAEESVPCLQQVLAINPSNTQAAEALAWYRTTLPHLFEQWRCPICGHTTKLARERCPACESVISLEYPSALIEPHARIDLVQPQLARLETELARDPGAQTHRAMGFALLNLGRFEEGIAQLRLASQFDRGDIEFTQQLQQLTERGLLKRAVTERVIASATMPPTLRRGLGTGSSGSGRMPKPTTAKRILVLHERSIVRQVIDCILTRHGYIVVTAADMPSVFDEIRQARPSLILLNLQFPSYDSLELCQMFHGDARTADASVILISEPGFPIDRARTREVRAADVLAQPIDPRELVELIARLCPQN